MSDSRKWRKGWDSCPFSPFFVPFWPTSPSESSQHKINTDLTLVQHFTDIFTDSFPRAQRRIALRAIYLFIDRPSPWLTRAPSHIKTYKHDKSYRFNDRPTPPHHRHQRENRGAAKPN